MELSRKSMRLPIRSRGGGTSGPRASPRFATTNADQPPQQATMPSSRKQKRAKRETADNDSQQQEVLSPNQMAERRQAAGSSSRTTSVRRNLFHQHLSRRPTTSSTSTSAETLRMDMEAESETSDIVIRDKNGDYEVDDPLIPPLDDQEEQGTEMQEEEKEKQRLADAVKHHQRDRNRAPSEPVELLEAVKASLRAKTAALADDNWMYEAEEEVMLR